jgi:regulator of sirC expression with transglutaminase-like and TPR domain
MTPNAPFRDYVRQDEASISPAVGALLFARNEYPALDVDLYLGRLDAFGRTARRRLAGVRDPYQTVRILNRLCFEDEGLSGDRRTFDDPRNVFLNEVLDRRLGVPITLSVIYAEVAARSRLPIRGVPFPGCFIVRFDHPEETLFIDPFNAGRLLSRDDLRAMLRRAEGGEADLSEELLRPIGPRAILARMLRRLQRAYRNAGAPSKALWATECLLYLTSPSAETVRDYAAAAARLLSDPEALADLLLRSGLDRNPLDAPPLQEAIRDLRRLEALMN